MMRTFVTAALVAALGPFGAAPAHAADAQTVFGRWAISATAQNDAGRVELDLAYDASDRSGRHHDEWSSSVALGEIGLNAGRLRAPIAPIAFRVERDPGSFACTGTAGVGSGAGQFVYEPSSAFDDALATRGIARPSAQESVELAMDAMTVAFIDTYVRVGTPHPQLADLVRLAQHGVGPAYADEFAASGSKVTSADQLVRMRDHGVTGQFVRALSAAGYRNVASDDLIRAVDHGVTARFVAALAQRGYAHLPLAELTNLTDHGVSIAFIDHLASHGYKDVSVHDLIRLRDSGL